MSRSVRMYAEAGVTLINEVWQSLHWSAQSGHHCLTTERDYCN